MDAHRIATQHDWIMLEPLAPDCWLVIDCGQEFFTGDGVIGRVQVFLGIWEAFTLVSPLERRFFDSRDSAIDSFAPWPAAEDVTVPEVLVAGNFGFRGQSSQSR